MTSTPPATQATTPTEPATPDATERWAPWVLVALVVVLALVLVVAAVAAGHRGVRPAVAGPDPGEGIGDAYYPTAGNPGYDVGNYDLDVAYDPATKQLTGVATITATATADLPRFDLDLVGLDVTSVQVDGAAAAIGQHDAELVVIPAQPVRSGAAFTTVVSYGGQPRGYPYVTIGGIFPTADGVIVAGEPEAAATWFPVNDHPRDKATYTVRISAPTGLAALANGVLQSKVDTPSRSGFTTWTWRESSPMAPYLATMVVGTYRVHESSRDGLPVVTAVHSDLPTSVDDQLADTPEIVDFLTGLFGPYPFDALGGIAVADPRVAFALENQTRPIYGPGATDTLTLAHELAHQWFGDSVSVHDWSEIWLNEGFATYAEWLWAERHGGSSAQQSFDDNYTDDPRFWQVPPADPGVPQLFGPAVYTRGAMTLQALRVTVGDEAFFQILRQWASSEKDSSATTGEFVALAEQVSGRQLDQLFQDWLYGTQRPPRP